MSIRVALLATAAAISSASAGAQPDKDQPQPRPTTAGTAPVVLASVSGVRRQTPTAPDRSGEPARRPTPRITTCRCADQPPAEEQPDE